MTGALRIARDNPGVDMDAARRAVADFLSALGIAVDREDLRENPGPGWPGPYAELFDARPLRLATFANDEGYDELVLARAIPFRTVCGGAGPRREDRHVGAAGHAARRPAQPGGVPRAGRRTALSTSCPLGQEGSRHDRSTG